MHSTRNALRTRTRSYTRTHGTSQLTPGITPFQDPNRTQTGGWHTTRGRAPNGDVRARPPNLHNNQNIRLWRGLNPHTGHPTGTSAPPGQGLVIGLCPVSTNTERKAHSSIITARAVRLPQTRSRQNVNNLDVLTTAGFPRPPCRNRRSRIEQV